MRIEQLYTYPIKGLSPQPLELMELTKGQGVPLDRKFAFRTAKSAPDLAERSTMNKTKFLALVQDEVLARFETRYDAEARKLDITDRETGSSQLLEIAAAARFFSEHCRAKGDAARFIEGGALRFTDLSMSGTVEEMEAISIINLASVDALADAIGQNVDPMRFRANIYVSGLPAWSEFDMLDQDISCGQVRLKVFKRTQRCAATHVNPVTAARDLEVVKALKTHFGHFDMGVYAQVVQGGTIRPRDVINAAR